MCSPLTAGHVNGVPVQVAVSFKMIDTFRGVLPWVIVDVGLRLGTRGVAMSRYSRKDNADSQDSSTLSASMS